MEHLSTYFLATLRQNPDVMVKWCMDLGLIVRKCECPRCGEEMKLVNRVDVKDGKQWRCQYDDVKQSIRKGSWFERSKLGIYEILMITYMWCWKVSNDFIMNDLNVTQCAVVDWKHFCREACVEMVTEGNEMLGGDEVIVEVNESEFKKRKYHRERFVEGKWVFSGVERGSYKCFMVVVAERNVNVLLNVIKTWVQPGSTVISDCWKAYNCLENKDFSNLIIKDSYNFKDPETEAHTNSFVSVWSTIKRDLSFNTSEDHFNSHLFEYMWRRRYAEEKAKLFNYFLDAIPRVYKPQTND